MVFRTNTCDSSAAAGTVVDGTNSAGSGNAFNYFNGSPVYTTAAIHGTKAIDCTQPAGTAAAFGWNGFTATLTFAYRYGLRRTATPSQDAQICVGRNATQAVHTNNLSTANKLKVTHGDGSLVKQTSTTTLTQDTDYRVEATGTIATTTTGQLAWKLFLGDSTTALESYSWTDMNFGTTGLVDFRLGKQASGGSLGLIIDDPAFDTVATFIGPYSGAQVTVRPTSTPTNADGWTVYGGAASIHAALADDDPATGAQSPTDPTADAVTIAFPLLANSDSISGAFSHRADGSCSLKYEVMQNTTVVATRTVSPVPATETSYVLTLTSGEAALVTDRSLLRTRLTADTV